ncbi:putative nuclease HARBI1 [Toxorhynchites rutilus septentrionalis]|nr:putative nuclease HARBI1 [Toxorhynchites rutilus septentrionalis]
MTEPNDFRNFIRMDAGMFDELLALVAPQIERKDTIMRDAIPVSQRLSITLRYLATGNTFEDLKFSAAVSPQSIGHIVIETCAALINSLKEYIKLPTTEEEWKEIARDFNDRWNFPNCLGAVDGKHVAIKKPHGSGSLYFNYKKFCSIVMMAVVNANYEFIMVDVGINGRISDGGVFNYTEFGRAFSNKLIKIPEASQLPNSEKRLPFVLLGDDAFAMTDNFMKPYPLAELSLDKRNFNYRLSRARRVVENAFGILVSRFGLFQKQISLSPEKAEILVMTCCYLHNYIRKRQPRTYITRSDVDDEDLQSGTLTRGSWRKTVANEGTPLQATVSRNAPSSAKIVRDTYCHYFNNEGQLSWQLKAVS